MNPVKFGVDYCRVRGPRIRAVQERFRAVSVLACTVVIGRQSSDEWAKRGLIYLKNYKQSLIATSLSENIAVQLVKLEEHSTAFTNG